MMKWLRLFLSFSLTFALASCESGVTETLVHIVVDPGVFEGIDVADRNYRVSISPLSDGGSDQILTRSQTELAGAFSGDIPTVADPLTHVVVPLEGDATRTFQVEVEALANSTDGFELRSAARARTSFVEGETREIWVYLHAGPCLGRSCSPSTTCEPNAIDAERIYCVDIPVVEPSEPGSNLPDGGVEDAGTDAMDASDADLDAPMDVPDAMVVCEGEGEPCTDELLENSGGPRGECEVATIACDDSGEQICLRGEAMPATTVCRAATGQCDVEEVCDGTSTECPIDLFAQDVVTTCGADDQQICVGGECIACTQDASCQPDEDNVCQRGRIDCSMGTPTCMPSEAAPAETVCRTSAGPCDVPEVCGGATTCPEDSFRSEGDRFLCRDAVGPCDVSDFCDGTSAACPNEFQLPGVECRAADGACGAAEFCDGVTAACPPDRHLPETMECRGVAGECDLAEFCSGTSAACPDDGFVRAGDICRPAASGCDQEETCSGASPACPGDTFAPAGQTCALEVDESGFCDGDGACDDVGCGDSCSPGPCADGVFDCSSGSPVCVVTSYRTGMICRDDSAGPCDAVEVCEEGNAECPADAFLDSTRVCRRQDGGCDLEERCDGVSPTCPVDRFQPAGEVCRETAGECDRQEVCSGRSPACPRDGFRSATTLCGRSSDGACDLQDRCSGDSAECRALVRPLDHICRPSVDEQCDIPERCDGVAPNCPPDERLIEDGEVCDSSGCRDRICSDGRCNRVSTEEARSCEEIHMSVELNSCQAWSCGEDGSCTIDNVANGMACSEFIDGRDVSGVCLVGECVGLKISEVQASFNVRQGAIELHNAMDVDFTFDRCEIEYGRSLGSTATLLLPIRPIPAGGFVGIVFRSACMGSDFDVCEPVADFDAGYLGPRVGQPFGVRVACSASGSSVVVLDAFGWAEVGAGGGVIMSPPFFEMAPQNGAPMVAYERRHISTSGPNDMCDGPSCPAGAGSHSLLGNRHDSGSSLGDFVPQTQAFIQHSGSPREP